MKVKVLLLILLIIFPACNLYHKKTEKIGECTWFTEYGYLDALEKAKKENKPIFVYFTAKWCEPCQKVKKEVFAKKEFKEVAKEAVLLKVEQSEIPGRALCRKYRISVYPSFRLIDKDGKVIDRGWKGYYKDKTADDILSWLKLAIDRKNQKISNKILTLPQLYKIFHTPPFSEIANLTSEERFNLIYNSLSNFAKNKKGTIKNSQYWEMLSFLNSYVSSNYKKFKTQDEKKNFLKKYDKKIINLIKKVDNKKKRLNLLGEYLSNTGRPNRALSIYKSMEKNTDSLSHDDILILKNEAICYIKLAFENSNGDIEKQSNNLLVKNNLENVSNIANRILKNLENHKKEEKIQIASFFALRRIIFYLYDKGATSLANDIALKSFHLLTNMLDYKNSELCRKRLDVGKMDSISFNLITFLEDFSKKGLIPDALIQFGEKNWRKTNDSFNYRIIYTVVQNYFHKKEYKKGIDFIQSVLNDKQFIENFDKNWWAYSLYSNLALLLLDKNVYPELAEKLAKKALKLHKKDEYAIYVLAMLKARKGDFQDAISLAKKSYEIALYRQYTDEELVKELKQKIKQWQKKL